jgi:predicted MFS family arabinose efflux permease
LSAIAPSFLALLVFQALVGLGYAVFSFSVSALVGEVFAYETRARAMGIVRFAVSVSALVGVPAVAAIADWGTARGSYGAVSGFGLVVLAVALPLLPRLSGEVGKTQPVQANTRPWRMIGQIAHQRSVMMGLLAVLAWATIPTGVFIYLAAWLEQAYHLTETQVGLGFSAAGLGCLVGNMLTAMWADRLGKKRSAVVGLLVLSVMAGFLARVPLLPVTLVALAIFGAALEFGFASFSTLMTELFPAGRGTLMSLVSLANGIGTGMVPLVMAPLWESGGYAIVTLALGAVGLGVTVFVGLLVPERQICMSGAD